MNTKAPAGWQLTPTDATPEMIAAGRKVRQDGYSEVAIFDAMLAAAPQPTPAEEAGRCTDCEGPVYHRDGNPGEFDHQCTPSPTPAPSVADIEERERMRLAGISTAALGYWKECDSIHPDYDTVALRDVAKLYAEYVTRTNERDSYKAGAERMQDALRVMARQKLSAEVSEEDRENADYEAGYEALVRQARAAIAQRGGKYA